MRFFKQGATTSVDRFRRLSRAIIRKCKKKDEEMEGRDSRRVHDYRKEGRTVALDKFHFTSFLRCAEPRTACLGRSLAGHNKLVKVAWHR